MEKRLALGQKGINGLDEACKQHDISYAESKNLKSRHDADKILAQNALARIKAKDASKMEKLAALGVAGAMKTKASLGMGYDNNEKKYITSSNMNNCIKSIEKVKVSTEKSLENIDICLDTMQRLQDKTDIKRKPSKRKITQSGHNENLDTILHSNESVGTISRLNENSNHQHQTSLLFNKPKSKCDHKDNDSSKRKLDIENCGPLEKTRKINNNADRNRVMRKKKKVNKTTITTTNKKIMTTVNKRKKRKLDIEKGVDDDDEPRTKKQKLDIRSFRKRIKKPNKKSKILFTRSGKKRKHDIEEYEGGPLKKVRKLLDTRLPIKRKRKLVKKKIHKLQDTKPSRKRKLDIDEDEDPLRKIRRQLDIITSPLPSNRKRKLNIIQDDADGTTYPKKMPKKYESLPVHRKRKYNNNNYYNDDNGNEPIRKKPKII